MRLEWTTTPNWIQHPLLFALTRGAISSYSRENSMIIHITRRMFWKIFAVFLVKDLEAFEEAMAEQGVNTRAELLAFFHREFRAIPRFFNDPEFLGRWFITPANHQPESEEEQP
ncbi:MAG: hypothetical protein GF308_08240 [Candidatus Heimdallarchaeota archaeon]|nr:hypothetical protein [Candidatus Heimdallarchaeota archaeon]